MTFVNISNHPSERWSQDQKNAVETQLGLNSIIDVPFPNVDPQSTEKEIRWTAECLCSAIIAEHTPEVVLIQGEFTLTYAMVRLFHQKGVQCCAATSERKVTEEVQPDGSVSKKSEFCFVKFRFYQ